MQQKTINSYLTVSILILVALPLLASYWLLDEVLKGATSLAIKPEQQYLLESYREDLKALRRLNPDKEAEYKARFQQASDELLVYQQPELLKQILRDTWLTYYLILFICVLSFASLAAVWLSRKVARAYNKLTEKDIANAKKIQELSYFDQWQTITRKLAHEINNPLTPIEMMVSNLNRSYLRSSPENYQKTLQDTQTVVSEEVQKLKHMVRHFSRFSKLPEPELKATNLAEYCSDFVRQHQNAWEKLELTFRGSTELGAKTMVQLDPLLFNQCLHNLINNALQANPQLSEVNVELSLFSKASGEVGLRVFNTGKTITSDDCKLIFQIYHSSKRHEDNMGLGLPIVKKIVLDHGGNIQCTPVSSGAVFDITLPVTNTSVQESNRSSKK